MVVRMVRGRRVLVDLVLVRKLNRLIVIEWV